MNRQLLEQLTQQLLSGNLPLDDFLQAASVSPTADLCEAQLDLDRQRRCGYPEVVFGEGKTTATLIKIFDRLMAEGISVFATRVSSEKATDLSARFPAGLYNPVARTFRIPVQAAVQADSPVDAELSHVPNSGKVTIVTAGTGDLPVAEEARETLLWMGINSTLITDVGVAGPHRLLEHLQPLRSADAVVVVAGMEGALPSVVGGHVACPVIAVPTSIGYGANLGGMAALLSMLNSCAANVTVVNIDAGFKGGYIAGMIAAGVTRAVNKGASE